MKYEEQVKRVEEDLGGKLKEKETKCEELEEIISLNKELQNIISHLDY